MRRRGCYYGVGELQTFVEVYQILLGPDIALDLEYMWSGGETYKTVLPTRRPVVTPSMM